MNYLQLAREVKRESGLSGGGPVSITTAAGDDLRIFNWVNWAARDITLSREDWRFRRGSATLASTTSQANPASAFGLTDFASWKAENNSYKPSAYRVGDGVAMEQALAYLSYDEFRQRFMVGAQNQSAAQYWTVSPSEDFLIGPAPDFAHFVRADYIKDYAPMELDTDVPIIPSRFHHLIVWRALMEYGGFDAASEVYQRAQGNYSLGYPQLTQSQLDAPTFGAASLGLG